MPITIDGTNGITQADQFNSDSTFGFKNRIINGAMVIDQRNAGASVTPTTDTYTLDRWQIATNVSSKVSVQQSSTVPTGFTNSTLITSLSAYTIGAGELCLFRQPIEGYNVADLGFGTANAKTFTVSFWVRSSLTGIFGGALTNGSENRSYPFTYTISTANTWEYETITIAGDTTGTWLTTNGAGLKLVFGLGVGSTFSGTAGAWSGSALFSATGATSVVGTDGATWYVTGVQLEVGSTATSFEYRQYTTELQLAQRYYQFVGGETVYQFVGVGMNYATNSSSIQIPILVRFRAIPSIGVSSVSHWAITYASGAQAVSTSITDDQSGTTTVNVGVVVTGTPLTNGGAAKLIAANTLSARITMSAEL